MPELVLSKVIGGVFFMGQREYNDFIVGQILVHAGMCARGEEVAAMGQRQGNDEDEHDDEVLISTVVPL